MGGFHIGMCMVRTIYSLFKRFGIVHLLSSAGLAGLGTVKRELTGCVVLLTFTRSCIKHSYERRLIVLMYRNRAKEM